MLTLQFASHVKLTFVLFPFEQHSSLRSKVLFNLNDFDFCYIGVNAAILMETAFGSSRELNRMKLWNCLLSFFLLKLSERANFTFRISLRWPIHVINPVDKTKLSCYTPHRRSTTVSSATRLPLPPNTFCLTHD